MTFIYPFTPSNVFYMNAYAKLNPQVRECGKKSVTKNLLKNNFVPGVIYFKGGDNANVSLTMKEMCAIINDPSALTRIYEVDFQGNKLFCILKEVQFNPALDLPRSFDLMEVKNGDIVKVNIPIRVLNKELCPGVKNGGDVYLLTYNVDLRCNVDCIPYAIEIDVKDCDMGAKFFLKDIKLPDGCKMINDQILLRIAGRRVIKEADAASATAETTTENVTATEGTAATNATSANTSKTDIKSVAK